MNNKIDMASLLLQVLNLQLLFQDYNNSDLMNELVRQDKEYFEKIIEQNNQILNILNERGDGSWKKD